MAFTTAEVPVEFLKNAFLVGHIPHRMLQSDKRISYSLYVPSDHYDGQGDSKVPLLVFIHGTGRNLATVRFDLEAFADDVGCAVLAPLFPAGLENSLDLDSYKLTGAAALRSDQALLAMMDEIERIWVGIETSKVYLMGFSGGGQFSHRFLYLHPERLLAVSVGAPGSVTLWDQQKDWPHGVKNMEAIFGRSLNLATIRNVPVHLVIGSADDEVHGGADFTQWLKSVRAHRPLRGQVESHLSAVHSQGRLQSLRGLEASLEQAGLAATFEIVDGVMHHGESVRPAQVRFIRERMCRKSS